MGDIQDLPNIDKLGMWISDEELRTKQHNKRYKDEDELAASAVAAIIGENSSISDYNPTNIRPYPKTRW
jgi:hypothetical protein